MCGTWKSFLNQTFLLFILLLTASSSKDTFKQVVSGVVLLLMEGAVFLPSIKLFGRCKIPMRSHFPASFASFGSDRSVLFPFPRSDGWDAFSSGNWFLLLWWKGAKADPWPGFSTTVFSVFMNWLKNFWPLVFCHGVTWVFDDLSANAP